MMFLKKLFRFLNPKRRKRGKKHRRMEDGSDKRQEDLENGEQFCPLCKNHCNLSAPKCKRGKEYAERAGGGNE